MAIFFGRSKKGKKSTNTVTTIMANIEEVIKTCITDITDWSN